ncbi:hypothetical protein K9B33_06040 [Sphingobium sp. 3R8]|nr:hypothetical protein [Sphingobium sp. 3R8]MBZ9647095.1 hypothetical protein [Sphingobium sp. 3R8]
MTGGPGERWRRRGRRTVRLALVFDDIMEFALALLSVAAIPVSGLAPFF